MLKKLRNLLKIIFDSIVEAQMQRARHHASRKGFTGFWE